jgi:hypothetical protein
MIVARYTYRAVTSVGTRLRACTTKAESDSPTRCMCALRVAGFGVLTRFTRRSKRLALLGNPRATAFTHRSLAGAHLPGRRRRDPPSAPRRPGLAGPTRPRKHRRGALRDLAVLQRARQLPWDHERHAPVGAPRAPVVAPRGQLWRLGRRQRVPDAPTGGVHCCPRRRARVRRRIGTRGRARRRSRGGPSCIPRARAATATAARPARPHPATTPAPAAATPTALARPATAAHDTHAPARCPVPHCLSRGPSTAH